MWYTTANTATELLVLPLPPLMRDYYRKMHSMSDKDGDSSRTVKIINKLSMNSAVFLLSDIIFSIDKYSMSWLIR